MVYFGKLLNDNGYRNKSESLDTGGMLIMRITPRMFSSYTNRMNPLAYTRRATKTQSVGRTKTSTTSSIARNRQVVNTTAVDKYIKLGENAETLRNSVNTLGSASKSNIFENARNTGSKDAILSQTKQMIGGYNSTISGITEDNSSLNRVYRQFMENAVTENSDSLAAIGIAVNKDKTLSFDETKFKNASLDEIEAVIGRGSRFTSRVGSMAENVSRNAISMATNLNSVYNSYGTYSSYGAYSNPYTSLGYSSSSYLSALLSGSSRFNFWG